MRLLLLRFDAEIRVARALLLLGRERVRHSPRHHFDPELGIGYELIRVLRLEEKKKVGERARLRLVLAIGAAEPGTKPDTRGEPPALSTEFNVGLLRRLQ